MTGDVIVEEYENRPTGVDQDGPKISHNDRFGCRQIRGKEHGVTMAGSTVNGQKITESGMAHDTDATCFSGQNAFRFQR